MCKRIIGFDIGGTKCAINLAQWDGETLSLLDKVRCDTNTAIPPEQQLELLCQATESMDLSGLTAVGISCGGPLDAQTGVILGPPNLPGWDHVEICTYLEKRFDVPAYLQNDANACALAEWKLGAGCGSRNMAFLTFGTGLGAGLILNGQLYEGTNGNAGEVGHIRLDRFGPVGYGKTGAFEGFCSGGGLAQLGWMLAFEQMQQGKCPAYFRKGMLPGGVTAKEIAQAAAAGDETAKRVFAICGEQLGRGLAILIDILNLDRIVIGSIFARAENLLRPTMEKMIAQEALATSAACCTVVPAALGEKIGDYAALCVALTKGAL